MKSFYFGPIEQHPFRPEGHRIQKLNPVARCFNFGGGNGWKGCWSENLIGIDVRDTINYAVYKNNSYGVDWHANDRSKANTWIKVKGDNGATAALMDISTACKKGKWNWTKGETYMSALREAIFACHEGTENGIYLHIVDAYKTLLQTQNKHEFFTDSYEMFPIDIVWQAFITWLVEQEIPFILTDTMWPNVVDEKFLHDLGGHEFDFDWLSLDPLSPFVEFYPEGPDGPILWTQRFRTSGPDRLWAAKRITINPNPYPVRNIPARSGISKFAWVWQKEREQMLKGSE